MDRMDDEKDSRGKGSVCLSKMCSREMHKKRATLACHSECLHNGIILIVYILQICCCKGSEILGEKQENGVFRAIFYSGGCKV
jgi:hypothetical protein